VIEPLLALPAHLRERLVGALEAGHLAPPYPEAAIGQFVGTGADRTELSTLLSELERRGISGPAIAFALKAADGALAGIPRPELVWSGPEVPGLHARDTRRVYEELVESAERSLWICAYTYYDGAKAFDSLARRMDRALSLEVTLLLNIQRRRDDLSSPDDLVRRFAERLWKKDWPGERHPGVFYDPRALALDGPEGVLHAKAVIADDELAFVTSANLTEKAFDHNIEVGLLARDPALAASLSKHFRVLIERGLLLPLPAA
jgi:phosphatidylserine/phosphatidylglycerophosphate/cardiolipin synthase-like enzyme